MKLGELFPQAPESAREIAVAGVTADSRRVAPGFVFAALAGLARHGRDFVAQAEAHGAAAILSAGDLLAPPRVAHVIDAEPRRALALAASRFYPARPAVLAAVTGTNGKSSTVDFLRQIWRACGKSSASLGTLGAIGPGGVAVDLGHTTPDPVALHETLSALESEGVTHAALEASSHGLEQHRLDGLSFDAGAFTNLTQDHLDYHADLGAYRAAKLKLWNLVRAGGTAVVNADAADALAFEQAAEKRGLHLLRCGWRAPRQGSLKIVEIAPRPNAQTLTLLWRGAESRVELPLIGEFQALNAVCAASLALALGETPEAVFAALERLAPVKGRMEHVGAARGAHVFVDYAHTPDGLDALIRAARPHAPGRVMVVFGCGGDRDRDKRAKMGAVAARLADAVIVTDDNPRSEEPAAIRAEILKGAPAAREIGGRGEAIEAAVRMLAAGDALLIAGKGHETGQIIKGVSHPFSDQEAARAALARIA